ncbi:MAG: beta-lactamase family protein [Myxococcales bacterium]|nr:beta-lactamase family protein [Myxococcales bacterium]
MSPVRRAVRQLFRSPEQWLARIETTLPTGDTDALTKIGQESPSNLDFEGLWRETVQFYAGGLHPAVGLTVFHKGRCVLDRTIGHVSHQPGEPPGEVVGLDTPFNLFSATKILTAMLIHALAEDHLIDLDKRVCHYLPGFEAHGKGHIRVRHLLNHTAGIPDMPTGIDLKAALQTGQVPWESLYELKPKWEPGRRHAYHAVTSWVLLQRIAEQVGGKSLQELLASRLIGPAGLSGLTYGVAADQVHRVAKHAYTGLAAPRLMADVFERNIGLDLDTAVRLTNTPEFLTAVLPSANICGTGRQVCDFLQMLLDGGVGPNGQRVLQQRTIDNAISDVTPVQLDGTFGFPMRYGLGVMMGGMRFSLFGLNTRGAFGHLGFTGVVVYADPARELAVAFLNTGKPMMAPGMVRWYWILQRLTMLVPRGRLPWRHP